MNDKDKAAIWDALFIGKIHVEDMIELERAGHPSGYKKGVLQRQLKEINAALALVE